MICSTARTSEVLPHTVWSLTDEEIISGGMIRESLMELDFEEWGDFLQVEISRKFVRNGDKMSMADV